MSRAGVAAGWIALLLTVAGVRLAVIDRPFATNDEGTAAGIPLMTALNYHRYGIGAHRLAGVLNAGDVPVENRVLYAHHPPTVPVLIALTYDAWGVAEWTSRLFPAICSVLATLLLGWMIARRHGHPAGIAAAGCYALCPMTIAFGDMPDFVAAPLVLMALLTVECFARFLETSQARWLGWGALAFVGGALVDWPIFFLPPILALVWMRGATWRRWWRVLPFALGCGIVLALLIAWTAYADPAGAIWEQITARIAGTHDQTGQRIPMSDWLWRVGIEYQLIRQGAIALLALAYLLLRPRQRADVPLMLLGWGALHLLIGYQGNYQHSFWSIVVTPGLAAAAGVVIGRLLEFRLPAPAAISGAVTIPILLGLLHWPTARHELYDDYAYVRAVPYSQRELADAIRSVAAPHEGVLTSDSVWSPALWFYADRQLRPVVRNPETFDQCLDHPHYLLPFNYFQPSGPPPRWFVLPDFDRPNVPALAARLEASFPPMRVGRFAIYDLGREK